MTFILIVTSVLMALSTLLLFVVQGGLSKKRRRSEGFWRRFGKRQLLVLPILLFVFVPALLGGAGSRLVRTRADESAYLGPIIDVESGWQIQSRASLKNRTKLAGKRIAPVTVPSVTPDGPTLRSYYVPQESDSPRAVAVVVHGLFRSAMEVETVAAIFRDLGADVFLLNLRNHGGSDHRPFTYGFNEKDDVLAGIEFLRKTNRLRAPLILFGVSMGAVVAARAAPEIPELRGLVLDAPMTELEGTVLRQLTGRPLHLPGFYANMVASWIEIWSGFDMSAVRPVEAIARLPETLPLLCIGAADDRRVPPHIVRAMHAAHPGSESTKSIWICPGAGHGQAWAAEPVAYGERLATLLTIATK